jgi:hypothetical protein
MGLFLKFKFNLLVKCLPFVECCFCHGKPGLNFARTSGIVCCQVTHIAKIFHIHYLFWSVLTCTGVAVLRFSLKITRHTNFTGYVFYRFRWTGDQSSMQITCLIFWLKTELWVESKIPQMTKYYLSKLTFIGPAHAFSAANTRIILGVPPMRTEL